jgi:hypothetical protein
VRRKGRRQCKGSAALARRRGAELPQRVISAAPTCQKGQQDCHLDPGQVRLPGNAPPLCAAVHALLPRLAGRGRVLPCRRRLAALGWGLKARCSTQQGPLLLPCRQLRRLRIPAGR